MKTPEERPAFQTRVGQITPTDVASTILSHVRSRLPMEGHRLDVVVTVPAGFAVEQREATMEAARKAGLDRVRIADEPVATANAYLLGDRSPPKLAAVYDLGGGTFDLAILRCEAGSFEVLEHGGDLYLGGDDIDHALATWVAAEVLQAHRWDLSADAEVFDRLVLECERAKMRLSWANQTHIALSEIDPAAPAATEKLLVDRARLSDLCSDLVRRTFALCDQVLASARIKAKDVQAVFLAGGSSQLPMIRSGVSAYFDRPPHSELDPMEVVAIGASRL